MMCAIWGLLCGRIGGAPMPQGWMASYYQSCHDEWRMQAIASLACRLRVRLGHLAFRARCSVCPKAYFSAPCLARAIPPRQCNSRKDRQPARTQLAHAPLDFERPPRGRARADPPIAARRDAAGDAAGADVEAMC